MKQKLEDNLIKAFIIAIIVFSVVATIALGRYALFGDKESRRMREAHEQQLVEQAYQDGYADGYSDGLMEAENR